MFGDLHGFIQFSLMYLYSIKSRQDTLTFLELCTMHDLDRCTDSTLRTRLSSVLVIGRASILYFRNTNV